MAMSATPSRQPKAVTLKKGPSPVATQQMAPKPNKMAGPKAPKKGYMA